MKKYVNYSVEDFVTDNYFRKWILGGGEVEEFWQHFLSDSPEKKHTLIKAAELIKVLQFRSSPPASIKMEQALQQTLAQIDTKNSSHSFGWRKYAAIVAVFLFVSSLSLFYFIGNFGQITHTTAFGEKQNLILPDGSEVILNANSSIVYDKDWKEGQLRKVNLKGEAFFEIVHQKNHAQFVVHTDAFDVKVVGTSFNLISRPNKHQVMLKEGKVEVHLSETSDDFLSFLDSIELKHVLQNKILQLSPNQLFEVNTKKRQFIHEQVNPDTYTGWLSNKFVCDQTSLSELALFIKNQYGWQVKTTNVELLNKELTGTIPTNNLDVLLEALPIILEVNIKVDKEKKEIILSDNPS